MEFVATALDHVWLIHLAPRSDERGSLARTYCEREFVARGLNTHWPQCNETLTRERGMLRGLHFQSEPQQETKLIRCTAGRVFDVALDIRRASPTFGKWAGFELDASCMLYVGAGCAHGFQCLTDQCVMHYQMSDFYAPDLAGGVRWDDPDAAIAWPLSKPVLSERDRQLNSLAALR